MCDAADTKLLLLQLEPNAAYLDDTLSHKTRNTDSLNSTTQRFVQFNICAFITDKALLTLNCKCLAVHKTNCAKYFDHTWKALGSMARCDNIRLNL